MKLEGWKRARLRLFRPQPHLPKFHPNPSKFPRFISENDVPVRYNNRRSDRMSDPAVVQLKQAGNVHRQNSVFDFSSDEESRTDSAASTLAAAHLSDK